MLKNKIFKQEIGIAEKSREIKRDCCGDNVNHKSLFDSVIHKHFNAWSQNRDLWFTLSPQQSLLVSRLFSVIPISCLKILFFNILILLKLTEKHITTNKTKLYYNPTQLLTGSL